MQNQRSSPVVETLRNAVAMLSGSTLLFPSTSFSACRSAWEMGTCWIGGERELSVLAFGTAASGLISNSRREGGMWRMGKEGGKGERTKLQLCGCKERNIGVVAVSCNAFRWV